MTIRIVSKVLDEIRVHASETYPEECCGLLIASDTKKVVDAMRMRNAYSGPKNSRYHIDPIELYKADRVVSQRGLAIAGIYHSHPDYPAVLSTYDLEHSFPWYSYVVVSVPHGKAEELKSWIPNENLNGITEEPIEILEKA